MGQQTSMIPGIHAYRLHHLSLHNLRGPNGSRHLSCIGLLSIGDLKQPVDLIPLKWSGYNYWSCVEDSDKRRLYRYRPTSIGKTLATYKADSMHVRRGTLSRPCQLLWRDRNDGIYCPWWDHFGFLNTLVLKWKLLKFQQDLLTWFLSH